MQVNDNCPYYHLPFIYPCQLSDYSTEYLIISSVNPKSAGWLCLVGFHAKTDSQSWWIKTGEKFHTLNIIFYLHDGSDGATIGESWALGWVHTWILHNSVYSAQYSFTIESWGKCSFLLVYKGSERCKSLAGVRMLPGSGMVPFVYKGSHIKG